MADQFSPDRVRGVLRTADTRLQKRVGQWQLLNAAYLTRYWEFMGAAREGSRWARWASNQTEVEVNRLWRGVMTYKASLYKKSGQIECSADPVVERGDARVASAVSQALWTQEALTERLDRCVELALLFPGSGLKVGVEEGRGPPLRRVWTRAIPWWEMVLDSEVTDEADERYRGHRYWMPREEAAEKYGLNDLVGSPRKDFLAKNMPDNEVPQSASSGLDGDADEGEWVEVLEFCDLVDPITARGGTYRGRLEVYILGQPKKEYDAPVRRTPLAFADADGMGMAHIEPLIFCHEPSFPLRGVSPCERILPQLVELNTYRSKMAELTRRNARKWLFRKGTIGDKEIDMLADGNDGQGIGIDDKTVPLGDIVHLLASPPPPTELWQYMNMVDQDYQSSWGQTAPAQGQATDKNKTAYAVQIEQFWTETEIGYHGQVMTAFSRRLLKLLQRAVVRAMTSVEATAEVPKGDTVALLPQGSVPAATAVSGEAAVIEQDDGGQAPAVTAAESPAVAVQEGAANAVVSTGPKVQYVEWTVRDADNQPLRVTIDALDGDFDIKFLEGARTPMTDAAVLQFLTTQFADYMAKFQIVLKGGPESVLARAWMKAEAQRAQLPPELMVDALEERAKRLTPPPAPPQTPNAAAYMDKPPAEEEPAPPSEGQTALVTALQSAAQALMEAAKGGDRALGGAASLAGHAAEAAQKGDLNGMEAAVSGAISALGTTNIQQSPEAMHAAQVLTSVMQAAIKSGQVAPEPDKQ